MDKISILIKNSNVNSNNLHLKKKVKFVWNQI